MTTGSNRCWDHEDCPRDDCDGELQQQDQFNVMCLECETVFTHQKDDDEHRLIHDCEFVARKPRTMTDGGRVEGGTERFGPQIASPLFNPIAEDTFDRALDAWGTEAQIVLAMEENSELNTELARDYRGRNDDEDVVDEIADVLIATRQLARIYGEEEVAERVRFKMDRLRERVQEADQDA